MDIEVFIYKKFTKYVAIFLCQNIWVTSQTWQIQISYKSIFLSHWNLFLGFREWVGMEYYFTALVLMCVARDGYASLGVSCLSPCHDYRWVFALKWMQRKRLEFDVGSPILHLVLSFNAPNEHCTCKSYST